MAKRSLADVSSTSTAKHHKSKAVSIQNGKKTFLGWKYLREMEACSVICVESKVVDQRRLRLEELFGPICLVLSIQ